MTRDRFDYTAAVAESWKSQMLLNPVNNKIAGPVVNKMFECGMIP